MATDQAGREATRHWSGVAAVSLPARAWCTCGWKQEADDRDAAERLRKQHARESHPASGTAPRSRRTCTAMPESGREASTSTGGDMSGSRHQEPCFVCGTTVCGEEDEPGRNPTPERAPEDVPEGWLRLRLGDGDASTDRWYCERCGAEYAQVVKHRCQAGRKTTWQECAHRWQPVGLNPAKWRCQDCGWVVSR